MKKYTYIISLTLGIFTLTLSSMNIGPIPQCVEPNSPNYYPLNGTTLNLDPLYPDLEYIINKNFPYSQAAAATLDNLDSFAFQENASPRSSISPVALVAAALPAISSTINNQEKPNIKQACESAPVRKAKIKTTILTIKARTLSATGASKPLTSDPNAIIRRGIKRPIRKTMKARTLIAAALKAQSTESENEDDYQYETDQDDSTDSQESDQEDSTDSKDSQSDNENEIAGPEKKRSHKKLKSATEKSSENKIKCRFKNCLTTFNKQSALDRHVRTHTGEKPFKCDQCDFAAAEKGNVARHIKAVHEKIKPFHCKTCNRNFNRKQHLEHHKTTHNK